MTSSWIKRLVVGALLACSVAATMPAHAAVMIIMKLTGIQGESQVAQHAGEIDALTWSWGVNREVTGGARPSVAGGAAKVSPNALVITKYVDAASPLLFQSAITGKHISDATLVVVKVGGKSPIEYIKIKLKDVVVTSVKTGAPMPNDRFTEEVALAFASAEYTYVRQNADQSAGAAVTVNW